MYALVGGHPVLDLVNTVSWRGDPSRLIERIPDFDAFVSWSGRAGLTTATERERLASSDSGDHRLGARAVRDAHWLREHLHDALTASGAARARAIELLWPKLIAAQRDAQPEGWPLAGRITLTEPGDLPRRLALLGLELLSSEDVRRVSVCADHACGWVFLDRSRNHTRRWCSSTDCGNRHRVRQYNARHAGGQRPPP